MLININNSEISRTASLILGEYLNSSPLIKDASSFNSPFVNNPHPDAVFLFENMD